jgi:UDP-N-acetylglucosamine 2-epimerase
LETLNLTNTKFLVSGAPYLENFVVNKNLSKVFNQKVLILLSGPGHSYKLNHHKEILTSLIRLSDLHTEINFVLKAHPKDAFSKNIVENSRIKFLSNEELKAAKKNILELITDFDLIISGASTSVIEAIALGKKVITIDYEKAYSEADFIQDGLTNHLTSENQLLNYFENLQSNLGSTKENANDISEYFQQNTLGLKPSEIIAKEILSCVE